VQISAKIGTGIENLFEEIRQVCGVADFDLKTTVCFTSRQEKLLKQLKEAKGQAADIIAQAQKRATEIVDEAKELSILARQ